VGVAQPQRRLTTGQRKYIEEILENRSFTEEQVEKVKEDIIYGKPPKKLIPGIGFISDPTAHKAVELQSQRWLVRVQEELEAIDRVVSRLDERYREVYKLRYEEGYGGRGCWTRIGRKVGYSARQCERINLYILKEMAKELGMG